jgi:hypothetical protein
LIMTYSGCWERAKGETPSAEDVSKTTKRIEKALNRLSAHFASYLMESSPTRLATHGGLKERVELSYRTFHHAAGVWKAVCLLYLDCPN